VGRRGEAPLVPYARCARIFVRRTSNPSLIVLDGLEVRRTVAAMLRYASGKSNDPVAQFALAENAFVFLGERGGQFDVSIVA
jgi:hypothetical protein